MKLVKESLNESLKDELIIDILRTVYQEFTDEEKARMRKHLLTLSEDQLDELLAGYYSFHIKRNSRI
jgi:hypothetical protein